MKVTSKSLAFVGLALAVALSYLVPTPAAAADQVFHLYGSFSQGWGDAPTALTNPGPTLTVTEGDSVTVTIHSQDATVTHNWYLDLDGDNARDAGEPFADDVSGTSASSTPPFTAPPPGTYTYFCEYHQSTMRGTFVVQSAGTNPPAGQDLTPALYAGIVVLVVVAALVAMMYMRGKRAGPKAP